ncbi:TIGR03619 family F420-dependent LLM class oxidoreductase [Rhodococcus erythropolis]|uniref:TIGR03619 family F420-dependent LLM class oxidoreductase n=1 Tax=Rhodococcus erythropolis TaxID=1833 RepID=UPI002949E61C|nr:TIGR03619 family F420-dependent LLM class oxidoreductase [Rhodococcus erythropolis]MDV6272991.1 TIGR03619 family F420-dependent LLM class oxidoreductase [Rhodococcus erythropolis]
MKYGINLPNFGPQIDPDGILAWARTAETAGFDNVLLSDHVVLTDDANRRSPAPFYECLATLSWLAAGTESIRLGSGVLIGSHRHPAHLAHATATIDRLSGGRLIVGIGVGWTAQAFDVLDVPFTRRGRLTDTTLETLIAAWTSETYDAPGSAGTHRVHNGPLPLQQPHPPLWIGGNGPAAIDRTNRLGTAWHPLHPSRDLCIAGVASLAAGREFVPRIYFLPAGKSVESPDRPLGYGTINQIRADIEFLTEVGAQTIVLDTDPGDQRLRRSTDHDLNLIRIAGESLGMRQQVVV